MTAFHVTVAWPAEWMTVRTVTRVSRRPCLHPVRVRAFTGSPVSVQADCGRRLPADQQCSNCRHTIAVQPQLALRPVQDRAAS